MPLFIKELNRPPLRIQKDQAYEQQTQNNSNYPDICEKYGLFVNRLFVFTGKKYFCKDNKY